MSRFIKLPVAKCPQQAHSINSQNPFIRINVDTILAYEQAGDVIWDRISKEGYNVSEVNSIIFIKCLSPYTNWTCGQILSPLTVKELDTILNLEIITK